MSPEDVASGSSSWGSTITGHREHLEQIAEERTATLCFQAYPGLWVFS